MSQAMHAVLSAAFCSLFMKAMARFSGHVSRQSTFELGEGVLSGGFGLGWGEGIIKYLKILLKFVTFLNTKLLAELRAS